MNTKYGRLSNGRIEYAPSSLETEDGVKMNPSEASYLAAGWKTHGGGRIPRRGVRLA